MKTVFLLQNTSNFFRKINNLQSFFSHPALLFFVNFNNFENSNNGFVLTNYIQFVWIKRNSQRLVRKFKNVICKKISPLSFMFKTPQQFFYFKTKKTSANFNVDVIVPFQNANPLRFFIYDFNLNCFRKIFWLLRSQQILFYFLYNTFLSFFLKSNFRVISDRVNTNSKIKLSSNLLLSNTANL